MTSLNTVNKDIILTALFALNTLANQVFSKERRLQLTHTVVIGQCSEHAQYVATNAMSMLSLWP